MGHQPQTGIIHEQKRKTLFDMTELALAESSSLISSLTQSEVRFSVDSIDVGDTDKPDALFDNKLSGMVAVCQRLDGAISGRILFMLPEASALVFIKKALNERDQLQEMTEMEEEALTEMGNIIINNCLSHYVKILHKSLSGIIPSLERGQYARLVDTLSSDSVEKEFYCVKINIQTMASGFTGYILWPGYLCQSGMTLSGSQSIPNVAG